MSRIENVVVFGTNRLVHFAAVRKYNILFDDLRGFDTIIILYYYIIIIRH